MLSKSSAADHGFGQRVRSQTIGAVHSGAGDLSHRVESVQRSVAVEVRADASTRVVGSRSDWNRFTGRVNAQTPTDFDGGRELLLQASCSHSSGIEPQMSRGAVVRIHALQHCERDNVARSEITQRMVATHHRSSVYVGDGSTRAAKCLGDEG